MQDAFHPASLYPTCDSIEEVISETMMRLPLITENQLTSVIQLTYNTTLNMIDKELLIDKRANNERRFNH
jgi:hypothetical protein